MRFRVKHILCLAAMLLAALTVLAFAAPEDYDKSKPEALKADYLYGKGCIVINADTGDVLFEKNADTRLYPASTTKIVTCILALEWAEENDMLYSQVVIPSGIAVDSSQSRMKLTESDTMTFEDLLFGMMLASGNDAAQAVAKIVSGSFDAFVRDMNRFVEELGISTSSTHFENVTGIHAANHYTCARDLAKIMAYCLKNETFREIIGCNEYTVYSTYWPDGETFKSKYDLIDSTAALYYKPCIGGKTGYTSKAGRSFVGAAQQNDVTLVAVSLNPPDANGNDKDYFEAFTDTIRLFKYGFLQYKTLSFKNLLLDMCDKSIHSINVVRPASGDEYGGVLECTITDFSGGDPDAPKLSDYKESYLKTELDNDARVNEIKSDFASRFSMRIFEGKGEAPIKEGDVIGSAEFVGKDGKVYEGTVVARRSVEREPDSAGETFDKWADKLPKWVKYLIPRYYPIAWVIYIALAALLLTAAVSANAARSKANKQRKAALEARRREYLKRMQREEYLRKHPEAAKKAAPRKTTAPGTEFGAKRSGVTPQAKRAKDSRSGATKR